MPRKIFCRSILRLAIAVAVTIIAFTPPATRAQQAENEYIQVNLVSNGSVPAIVMDPNLINPWGMVASATSPVWVSDQGTRTATLYAVSGTASVSKVSLTVSIPAGPPGPNGPTGIVFNGTSGFKVPSATTPPGAVPSSFIFANLNGTISGWNPGSTGGRGNAVVAVQTPGAVYTGLALGTVGGDVNLYAADFTPSGGIRVFDSSFQPATNLLPDAFVDNELPGLPPDEVWAPYNIANINGMIYVAYDAMPEQGGLPIKHIGLGVIAVFTTQGEFVRNLVLRGQLDAPWGMVMAPGNFGRFSNHFLVGNFGDGRILAYRSDGGFADTLRGPDRQPLENGALWTLRFGNGGRGGDPDILYITTGGANELTDGLLASIAPAQAVQ